MRPLASAGAYAAVLFVVLVTAACGSRFEERVPAEPPTVADLTADAVAALDEAGSAHFVAETRMVPSGLEAEEPWSFTVEGAASRQAVVGTASISVAGQTFSGKLLAGEREVFVQFLGEWYGMKGAGLADVMKEQPDVFADAERVRREADRLLAGEVTEGPVVDGVATWQFVGRLTAAGLAEMAEADTLPSADRARLARLADVTRILLVVGRDDKLPRRVEFELRLTPEDLEDAPGTMGTFAFGFHSTTELSRFGEPVSYEPPESFQPLEGLLENAFGALE